MYRNKSFTKFRLKSIGLLHLKSIHLLWKIYHKHSTGGVWFSNGLTYCTTLFTIHTPSVLHFVSIYRRGCRDFMWKCPVGYSTWNSYSLCERFMVNLPQGECGFLMSFLILTTRRWSHWDLLWMVHLLKKHQNYRLEFGTDYCVNSNKCPGHLTHWHDTGGYFFKINQVRSYYYAGLNALNWSV